jgi:hypothetical protein
MAGAGSSLPAPTCVDAPSASSPRSIAEVVDWLNALAKPVSLPCFLETLARPLELYASESLFSAQPAVGRRSPRIFLFAEPLTMTIAAAGAGRHLLEFGERRSDTTSLKGEIPFPVTAELREEDPFEHLISDLVPSDSVFTTCSACHDGERPDEAITFARAFVSQALRPLPAERVSLNELNAEARTCDFDAEPERCAMLSALFSQGDVVDGEFSSVLATFY